MSMSTNPNYLVQIIQYGEPGSASPTTAVTAPVPESVEFAVNAEYSTVLPQSMASSDIVNGAAAMMGMKLAVQAMTAQLWNGSTNGNLSINLEFTTETDPIQDIRAPVLALTKLATPSIHDTGFMQSPGPQLDFSTLSSVGKDILNNAQQSGSAVVNAAEKISGSVMGIPIGKVTQGTMSQANKQLAGGTGVTDAASTKTDPSTSTSSAAYWKNKITNLIQIRIGNYLFFDNVIIDKVANVFTSNFDPQTGLPHHVVVSVQFRPMFTLTQNDLEDIFLGATNTTTGNNTYGFKMPDSVTGSSGGNQYGVGNNTYGFSA